MNDLTRTNEIFRSNRPPELQASRREGLSCTADGQRSFPHVRQCRHANMFVLIVGNPFVDFIRDANHLMLLTELADVFQFFIGENLWTNKCRSNEVTRRRDLLCQWDCSDC